MRQQFFDPQETGWTRHHHHHRHHRERGPLPPWGRGFRPGGGRRAGRGDIRAAILVLLAEEPMHGYQIINEITERSEGAWQPSPGSVYPTLQQLADEGLLSTRETDGRRIHELTDAGREQAAARTGAAPWEAAASESEEPHAALRQILVGVMSAARQVAQTGGPEQVTAAQDILREARKRLYHVLAEDE